MHDQDKDRGFTRVRLVLLTGIAGFFVWFGIALLVASYQLGDPFSFIMTFFAASLIILISMVMVVGFILRIWRTLQAIRHVNNEHADS